MKSNYLNPKVKEPLKKYERLLHQYNAGALNDQQIKEMVRLSTVLIAQLIKDATKATKQSMMDGDAIRLLPKN